MKLTLKLSLIILLATIMLSCKSGRPEPTVLEGAWEFTGDISGMAIYSGNHFLSNTYFTPDSEFGTSLDTAGMLKRFVSMGIVGGTFTVQDSTAYFTNQFNKIPGLATAEWKSAFKVEDENIRFRLYDDDGGLMLQVTARRVGK